VGTNGPDLTEDLEVTQAWAFDALAIAVEGA
jgi:hypothetical protein